MAEFRRERKYLVLKLDDIATVIPPGTWLEETLLCMLGMIEQYRKGLGKKENTYVVVNEDEPYAEEVWRLIEAG